MIEQTRCKIWAEERSPEGYTHRCHAEAMGLDGKIYPKEEIDSILRTRPTLGGTWELAACEPQHDGTACKDCKYEWATKLAKYFYLGMLSE